MNPPTAIELVGPPPYGPDREWALDNFLGKTEDEAIRMFQHTEAVADDFAYMAAAGLCYYLPAALRYLKSEDATAQVLFAGNLMCALFCQVKHSGIRGEPLVLIKQIAEYCDANRTKFDLTSEDLFDGYLDVIRNA